MSIGHFAVNGVPLPPPSVEICGLSAKDREPPFIFLVIIIALIFLGVVGSQVLCNPARAQESKALRPVPDARFTPPPFVCPPKGVCIDGQIVRVIDGDTVVVRSQIEYHVRLLDCWAPESRTKDSAEKSRGLQAKARMSELAAEKPCRVFMPAAGSVTEMITFGRILGRVWILRDDMPSPEDLSAVMVAEGLATKTKIEVKP